jgi:hypothetical protein
VGRLASGKLDETPRNAIDTPLLPTPSLGDATRPAPVRDIPGTGPSRSSSNRRRSPKRVVKYYNGRGTAEQWIKEGKNALKWTRLSCRRFRDNQARL